MLEVKSFLAATTQLPVSQYSLSHPRVAIDNIFPESSASCRGSSDVGGMIELRDEDCVSGWTHAGCGGWSQITSCDFPLFLTPLTYHEADWQLSHIKLRMSGFCRYLLGILIVYYAKMAAKKNNSCRIAKKCKCIHMNSTHM